jgi:hypothetical protein
VRGDEIVRILDQFFLRQPIDQADNRAGADDCHRDPAGAFEQCVCTLEEDADFENLMDAVFAHAQIGAASVGPSLS